VVDGSGNGVGGEVLCVFVSEVFVGFVSNVIDAVLFAERVDGPKCGFRIDGSRGIVRRDGDDGPGFGSDRCGQLIGVRLMVCIGGHCHRFATGNPNGHFMIKIVGDRNDDFVAGISDGKNCVHEAHVGSSCDDDAFLGIELDVVVCGEFGLDGVEEFGNALDEFVFVVVGAFTKGG